LFVAVCAVVAVVALLAVVALSAVVALETVPVTFAPLTEPIFASSTQPAHALDKLLAVVALPAVVA
jgi:hypothetical protein